MIRNDEMTVEEIRALNPKRIILSPGPGRPEDAGAIIEVAKTLGKKDSNTWCLPWASGNLCSVWSNGHLCKRTDAREQSQITFDKDCLLFRTCPENMSVARYHSLAAEIKTMPECLKVTAKTEDGEVMAVQHKDYPIYGVQFHPESIMTPDGKTMLKNFLQGV